METQRAAPSHVVVDSSRPPTESRSWGSRAARLGYVVVVGAVGAFVFGFFTVTMIEAFGPSTTSTGQVLERNEGTRTVRTCSGSSAASCGTTTYPSFTLIGERSDATSWIVVGEAAFDAMRGEQGQIEVRTSTITDRVVGLDGSDDSWSTGDSGQTWFALGAVVVFVLALSGVERSRRRGTFAIGRIPRVEFLAVAPAVAIGLFGAWFVLYSKTVGLDPETSADRFGGFLDDPAGFLAEEPDHPGEGQPIPNGRWVGRSTSEITIVGFEDLAADQRDLLERGNADGSGPTSNEPSRLVAIPLLQSDTVGGNDRVVLRLAADPARGGADGGAETGDGVTEAVDCPSRLVEFGDDDHGFVCFPGSAAGDDLVATIGTGTFVEGPYTLAYDVAFVTA